MTTQQAFSGSGPGEDSLVIPQRAVLAKVRRSGSSFYWAMRLLPRLRREAIFAVYAFCREVDDIADGNLCPEDKLAALAGWRREIVSLFQGQPRHPITRAAAAGVAAYGLAQADFEAVIDGMEMDARQDIRAPSLAELDLYCDRVASAVGRLSVRAFGSWTERADDVARSLGRALQLTNILRDIAEDAGMGRLYLPAELLEAHGIASRQPLAVLRHPGLPGASSDLAALARHHFAEADAALAQCPRAAMRPAAVMRAVYGVVLERLEATGWAVPEERVSVPRAVKLWYTFRYAVL